MSYPTEALGPPAPLDGTQPQPFAQAPPNEDEDVSDRALSHARAIVPHSILRGTALEDHLTWSMDPRNVPEAPPEEEPFAGVPAQVRTPCSPIPRFGQNSAVHIRGVLRPITRASPHSGLPRDFANIP